MPTYRYECAKCARIHEYFQSISEAPKKRCPECGGRLDRLIGGGAGVILKGSGFHRTDYRSKSWHESARKEGGSPGGAKEKGTSASDGAKGEGKGKGKAGPKPKE